LHITFKTTEGEYDRTIIRTVLDECTQQAAVQTDKPA